MYFVEQVEANRCSGKNMVYQIIFSLYFSARRTDVAGENRLLFSPFVILFWHLKKSYT